MLTRMFGFRCGSASFLCTYRIGLIILLFVCFLFCFLESRIAKTCTDMSLTATGTLLYLNNKEYSNPIRLDESHCTCSIETKSCDTQINVYFLHIDLKCKPNQKVVITDRDTTHTYTCADNNNYNITLRMTSTTNYITILLDNPNSVIDGHIWLGFEGRTNLCIFPFTDIYSENN